MLVVKDIRTSTRIQKQESKAPAAKKTGYFKLLLVGKTVIVIFLFENCDFGVYSLTKTRRWKEFLNLGQMRQDAIISYSVYVPVPVFTCNASLSLKFLVNGEEKVNRIRLEKVCVSKRDDLHLGIR